jgi:Domain of unknown function (DUF4157)
MRPGTIRRFSRRSSIQRSSSPAQSFFQPASAEHDTAAANAFFSPAPTGTVQPKLKVNEPGDRHEQEADAMANAVVQRAAMPEEEKVQREPQKEEEKIQKAAMKEEEKVQRAPQKEEEKIQKAAMKEEEKVQRAPQKEEEKIQKAAMPEEEKVQRAPQKEEEKIQKAASGASVAAPAVTARIQQSRGRGNTLPQQTQGEMASAFGFDFSNVKVHTGQEAAELSTDLHAHAFTVGNDVYFNQGKFAPNSQEGKKLLAHELTHVVQQNGGQQQVQRVVEVRPPGRGEASAFDRRDELIDRMNAVSRGLRFSLDGRRIVYEMVEGGTLSAFDREMIRLIDGSSVLPMRLITKDGLVGDRRSGFQPLLIDSLSAAYVDLDDMMASDDLSFQMNLVHFLRERASIRNYERRIGTNISEAEFNRAHSNGIESEVQVLRDTIGDPTIRFVYEEPKSNGTVVFGFRGTGFWVFHVFRGTRRNLSGGFLYVQAGSRRLSVDEFVQERNAASSPS